MRRSPSPARPATFSSAAASKYVCANPQPARRPVASPQRRRPPRCRARQFFALVLIDQPCADRALERANFVEQFAAVVIGEVYVEDDITDIAVGLEILGRNINVALEKYFVQAPQHARYIVVDMAEAHPMGTRMKLHLRKIDRAHG